MLLKTIKRKTHTLGRHLLLIPRVRHWVSAMRLEYYVKFRKSLRTLDSHGSYDNTVKHNMKGLKGFCFPRMDMLIRPLTVIETLRPDSKILVVGPRNESDLLLLRGYGFHNVHGLDLITYSPWIHLGDMHNTAMQDSTWDAIIMGWCLSYSQNPKKAADEMVRIAKNNALIGVGIEYDRLSPKQVEGLMGYQIRPEGAKAGELKSVKDILDLFSPSLKEVYFAHDAPRKHQLSDDHREASELVTIFSVKK